MLGVERIGDFLPGVENIGLSVIGDKKILSVRYNGETITKTYEFPCDDSWVSLEIDGTEYSVNIWESDTSVWNAAIHDTEEVEDGEGGTRVQIDTNVSVAIYQETHPECFSIVTNEEQGEESGSIEEVEKMDNLIDTVIEKIKEDINFGDMTAIDELLRFIPKENLIGFLSEEQWGDFK